MILNTEIKKKYTSGRMKSTAGFVTGGVGEGHAYSLGNVTATAGSVRRLQVFPWGGPKHDEQLGGIVRWKHVRRPVT